MKGQATYLTITLKQRRANDTAKTLTQLKQSPAQRGTLWKDPLTFAVHPPATIQNQYQRLTTGLTLVFGITLYSDYLQSVHPASHLLVLDLPGLDRC